MQRKKPNDDENAFLPLEKKECELTISGYGWNENSLALKVDKITYHDENEETQNVPTFAKQQHVTLGLKAGQKAVDSVKTLLGEGTFVEFDEKLILNGKVKRYLY